MSCLSLRVAACWHGQISNFYGLEGASRLAPLRGQRVLLLQLVPTAAEPAVFQVYHGLSDQLVGAETVIVVQLLLFVSHTTVGTGTGVMEGGGGGRGGGQKYEIAFTLHTNKMNNDGAVPAVVRVL